MESRIPSMGPVSCISECGPIQLGFSTMEPGIILELAGTLSSVLPGRDQNKGHLRTLKMLKDLVPPLPPDSSARRAIVVVTGLQTKLPESHLCVVPNEGAETDLEMGVWGREDLLNSTAFLFSPPPPHTPHPASTPPELFPSTKSKARTAECITITEMRDKDPGETRRLCVAN